MKQYEKYSQKYCTKLENMFSVHESNKRTQYS